MTLQSAGRAMAFITMRSLEILACGKSEACLCETHLFIISALTWKGLTVVQGGKKSRVGKTSLGKWSCTLPGRAVHVSLL